MAADECLVVFTRYPKAGWVKTRLIPEVGARGAAAIQRRISDHVVALGRELQGRRGTRLVVRYEGATPRTVKRWLARGVESAPQGEGDLGTRMRRCLEDATRGGARRAVLVGCDCPGLTIGTLGGALDALQCSDVVLGPAVGGGCYLVGWWRPVAGLFERVDWDGRDGLTGAARAAEAAGARVALVEELREIDSPEDLTWWRRESGGTEALGCLQRVSVVVPALNAEGSIREAVASARPGSNAEVVVVDGGSADDTAAAAAAEGATVVHCQADRAQQMNFGARHASGSILVFLHADTVLPRGYDQAVRQALSRPGAAGGAFRFRTDSRRSGLRLIGRAVDVRSVVLRSPCGDQALFLRADLFREMGGFRDLPIMEDHEFVRRLRRRGALVVLPGRVVTSPRRRHGLGAARTTAMDWAVVLGYHLGVPPSRLAALYGWGAGRRRLRKPASARKS